MGRFLDGVSIIFTVADNANYGQTSIDIVFNTNASAKVIPEPSSCVLFRIAAMGALLIFRR